ncbi:hypothetical protein [Pseudomonas knackmussii]|uniref:Nuclear transport factor 2 family protein n=1 Tax=Pseudomonas knackmussii TaxID=65741 RepID=A0ABY4KQB8_9PSED|nr:hypothetical protein [Pseudomonas knackmussii]UPQ83061.1 hypothetical protein M0M42_01210 [Pseudomonas knackmussii]
MPLWKLAATVAITALVLAGCSREDSQAALESAAQSLQDSIGGKDNDELMARIHPEFSANQQLDREWVRRTAALMFLRHGNVGVIALNPQSWIDPTYPDKGYSEAQVALTGAERWLPQRVGHYHVKLEWWREDGEWLLARLDWD